ncbi:MAG: diaminopimelate decarboxylase [Trueperaceae bacterium]
MAQDLHEAELFEEAAARFGTPTYLYDLPRISDQAESLRRAFPTAHMRYAVKANANGALLRHVAALGFGAEALTLGELERSLRAGFAPGAVVLGGPGVTAELARRSVEAGVSLVSLDGPGVYELYKPLLGCAAAANLRFMVRLNPGFDPDTHEHLATAAASSKFGLATEDAARLAESVASDGRLAGFHVHAGSMLTNAEVAHMVVAALEPLYARFQECTHVDLGGGFAVPGAPLAQFAAAYTGFAERHGVELILEPGRFLVADAGVLLTRVLHVKRGAKTHVIADAGMADLLRPALYGATHPVWQVGADPAEATHLADVDGPLCENADRLAQAAPLSTVSAGDLLAVRQAGAYGFAMASNYASSLRPAEVVWDGAALRLARRRERPEDLWRLETND